MHLFPLNWPHLRSNHLKAALEIPIIKIDVKAVYSELLWVETELEIGITFGELESVYVKTV